MKWKSVIAEGCLVFSIVSASTCAGQTAQTCCSFAGGFNNLGRTQTLIAELSSDDYERRVRAFAQLKRLGTGVFDELFRARSSTDVEVAEAANRLISLMEIQPALTSATTTLIDYSCLDFSGRAKKIIQMGRNPTLGNRIGLMRVARFEMDEVLSQNAAVELITGHHSPQPGSWLPSVDEELATSNRTASQLIRAFAESESRPMVLTDVWKPMLDELLKRYGESNPWMMTRLLQWYAEQLYEQADDENLAETVQLLIKTVPDQPNAIIDAMDWLAMHGQSKQCNRLAERFEHVFEHNPMLLFRMAELNRRIGDDVRSDNFAQKAINETGTDPLVQIQTAIHLQHAGLNDWATDQLESAQQNPAADWSTKVQASCLLGQQLHELGRNLQAAKQLQMAIEQFSLAEDKVAVQLGAINRDTIFARQCYFYSLHNLAIGQYEQAKQHLLEGLAVAPANSDLLITLYALPLEQPWKSDVAKLIELALQQLGQQIDQLQKPVEGTDLAEKRWSERELAVLLNRYAWLAANSHSKLAEAEQFSRAAVAIAPNNGDFLDTLATCLYRQNKFSQAVEIQKRAIAQKPYSNKLKTTLSRYREAVMFAELPKDIR